MKLKIATKEHVQDVLSLDLDCKSSWGNLDDSSGGIKYFNTIIEHPQQFKFNVLYDDNILAGYVVVELFLSKSLADLQCLCINPLYRRQGYGKQLLNLLERLNVSRIKTFISEYNVDGQLFLKACGYKWVKTYPTYYLDEKGNKNRAAYKFVKDFDLCEGITLDKVGFKRS